MGTGFQRPPPKVDGPGPHVANLGFLSEGGETPEPLCWPFGRRFGPNPPFQRGDRQPVPAEAFDLWKFPRPSFRSRAFPPKPFVVEGPAKLIFPPGKTGPVGPVGFPRTHKVTGSRLIYRGAAKKKGPGKRLPWLVPYKLIGIENRNPARAAGKGFLSLFRRDGPFGRDLFFASPFY